MTIIKTGVGLLLLTFAVYQIVGEIKNGQKEFSNTTLALIIMASTWIQGAL